MIIERTDNDKTLDSWCLATSLYPALYQFAVQVRWADITISQRNLISESSNSPKLPWRDALISRVIHKNTFKTLPPPASLIKRLTLWLQFNAPDKNLHLAKTREFWDENDIWNHDQLPFSDDIQYSLQLLLPECTSLTQLDHDGVLYQENLDGMIKFLKAPLRGIRLRMTCPNFPARWRHSPGSLGPLRDGRDRAGHQVQYNHPPLVFSRLGHFTNLSHLEVGQIRQAEGYSLGKAVEQLHQLESLSLVAGGEKSADGFWPGVGSALLSFLVYVLPDNSQNAGNPCKLPRTLQSLILSDPQAT